MTAKLKNDAMNLPAGSLDVMREIREYGGFICTGSCKQIKKGQLHCRNLGSMLGIGPAAIWEVVNALMEKGILAQGQLEKPVTINLTAKGEKALTELTGQS